MLTGRLPFLVVDRRELYHAHLEAPVPRMREVAPERDIPRSVDQLMRRLLAKRPEDRPDSATAVRKALAELVSEAADRLAGPLTERLTRPGNDDVI